MIQPNELRKANKIYGERRSSAESRPHLRVCTVLSITQHGSDVSYAFAETEHMLKSPDGIDGYAFLEYQYMHPIPLTAEWLDRMGFIKDRNGWHLPETRFSLTENLYPCWLDKMLWPQDIPDFQNLTLNSVGQLQNLYFALTGEELAVQL